MEHSIQHPRLGEVRGLLEDGVKQFRGIKFANLKDRFASPEIKEDYGGKIDATRHGFVFALKKSATSEYLT